MTLHALQSLVTTNASTVMLQDVLQSHVTNGGDTVCDTFRSVRNTFTFLNELEIFVLIAHRSLYRIKILKLFLNIYIYIDDCNTEVVIK